MSPNSSACEKIERSQRSAATVCSLRPSHYLIAPHCRYDTDDENYNAKRTTSRAASFVIVNVIRESYYDDTTSQEKRVEMIMKRSLKKMFLLFSRPAGSREISALSVCEKRRACASVGSTSPRRQ